jgi:hypothetical protein
MSQRGRRHVRTRRATRFEMEIWEHMGHVFQALPLPQAAAALEHIARLIEIHAARQQ